MNKLLIYLKKVKRTYRWPEPTCERPSWPTASWGPCLRSTCVRFAWCEPSWSWWDWQRCWRELIRNKTGKDIEKCLLFILPSMISDPIFQILPWFFWTFFHDISLLKHSIVVFKCFNWFIYNFTLVKVEYKIEKVRFINVLS